MDSVVLTTEEYFENYRYPSSYGYANLYSHLDETCCFVGNSLTDYEEQKVISAHFKRHPSQFHYWYDAKTEEKSVEAIMYKTVFLLKIGVIPLWYSNHSDYQEILFEYANHLLDHNTNL